MKSGLMRLPGGVSLFVRTEGNGHPVLLMHGGPGADHSTMLPFLACADQFRLILYDHRCNGRSVGVPVSTMTWENLCSDAEALREAFGYDRWAVIGHSFGGMVALEYAIRHPGAVSHLCIIDSGGEARIVQRDAPPVLQRKGYGPCVVRAAERLFNGRIGRHELLVTMVRLGRAYYSDPSAAFMLREALHGLRIRRRPDACIHGFGTLLRDWTVMERLCRITAPTLVIAGRDDYQFPPAHQRLLARGIPGSRLEIIDGAGHNAPSEKTAEVVALLREFIPSGAGARRAQGPGTGPR